MGGQRVESTTKRGAGWRIARARVNSAATMSFSAAHTVTPTPTFKTTEHAALYSDGAAYGRRLERVYVLLGPVRARSVAAGVSAGAGYRGRAGIATGVVSRPRAVLPRVGCKNELFVEPFERGVQGLGAARGHD